MSTFESFREVTGWIRPGHHHGCKPVEIVPGLWTAHYDDIDTSEKLGGATNDAPIALIVNAATAQCPTRTGHYGSEIRVLEVNIEDDPDERKRFDQGLEASKSRCRDPNVLFPSKRCAGDMLLHFDKVSDEIHHVIAKRRMHVLVHCKASLSRSPALIVAYLMKYHSRGMSATDAARLLKGKWDANWPCDRFAYDLVEYERRLSRPHRMSTNQLLSIVVGSVALGASLSIAATLASMRKYR